MASIRSEYHRFLAHLTQRHVHDDVRRLAHLVLDHLQPLAEVGAARRGRSTRLAPLAIAHLAQMPVAYDGDARGPENGPALGRLHQLEVGPFRGFMRQETFDLSHDITLVYGANGTGKSSFCEALEVAMLGSISEAQAKRVDQRTYCNNARLRRHIAPVLSSTAAGEAQAVQPDEAEYRFCFIEKNRLDVPVRGTSAPRGGSPCRFPGDRGRTFREALRLASEAACRKMLPRHIRSVAVALQGGLDSLHLGPPSCACCFGCHVRPSRPKASASVSQRFDDH